jgi:hypothetical protein
MSYFQSDGWLDTYRAQGLAKSKLLTATEGWDENIFDFRSWIEWRIEAGSVLPKAISPSQGNSTWALVNTAGQSFHASMRDATVTSLPKLVIGRNKWYCAARLMITNPVVFPLVNSETVQVRLPVATGNNGSDSLMFGMIPGISTSHWSWRANNGFNTATSTKPLTNGWTTIEMWSDGTLSSNGGVLRGQVTDSSGTEAPRSLGWTFADASIASLGLCLFSGGSLASTSIAGNTFLIDRILVLNKVWNP